MRFSFSDRDEVDDDDDDFVDVTLSRTFAGNARIVAGRALMPDGPSWGEEGEVCIMPSGGIFVNGSSIAVSRPNGQTAEMRESTAYMPFQWLQNSPTVGNNTHHLESVHLGLHVHLRRRTCHTNFPCVLVAVSNAPSSRSFFGVDGGPDSW